MVQQNNSSPSTPKVILFDVNETLLDMTPVKRIVNEALSSKRGCQLWFTLLLQYSLVDNNTEKYHDFTAIAGAALDMAAAMLREETDEEDKKEVLQALWQLPLHKDAIKGLTLLKNAGFRLAVLTNSPGSTLTWQLQKNKMEPFFEVALSVDSIQKYKPALEVYQWAVQSLGVQPNEVIMVAAHGWDIAGALQAGLQAAFIHRTGQSLYPLAPLPTYKGKNLIEVANQIMKRGNHDKGSK